MPITFKTKNGEPIQIGWLGDDVQSIRTFDQMRAQSAAVRSNVVARSTSNPAAPTMYSRVLARNAKATPGTAVVGQPSAPAWAGRSNTPSWIKRQQAGKVKPFTAPTLPANEYKVGDDFIAIIIPTSLASDTYRSLYDRNPKERPNIHAVRGSFVLTLKPNANWKGYATEQTKMLELRPTVEVLYVKFEAGNYLYSKDLVNWNFLPYNFLVGLKKNPAVRLIWKGQGAAPIGMWTK